MDRSTYTKDVQKSLKEQLLDVANRLAKPPSSVDELLSLLTRTEDLLSTVFQKYSCQDTVRFIEDAIRPAMQALISNEIFKHPCLNIQIVVASCISEIVRITIAETDFPYTEGQMKEIFQLYMIAFKQLSCESGKNYERAARILYLVAKLKSCLILLDLKIEIDSVVVEMFQIFFDVISFSHATVIFDHMKSIMILMIEESDDISMELLRPLMSSVKLDNKNTSPKSWELGKSVIESCASRLRRHIKNVVKELNLNIADYAEIVASLYQDTTIGSSTVANKIEEVATVQAANEEIEEDTRVQVENEEVKTIQIVAIDTSSNGVSNMNKRVANEEVAMVQAANEEAGSICVANEEVIITHFEPTNASVEAVSKLAERSMAGLRTQEPVERSRRRIKYNRLMRPEEGYQYTWWSRGGGSKNAEDLVLPSEFQNAKMLSDSSQEEINSHKKSIIGRWGQFKKQEGMTSRDKAKKYSSKSTKELLQCKVKEECSGKQKKTTKGVIFGSTKVDIESEHESGDVDKVVESLISEPTKANQYKVEEKGSKKGKNTTKGHLVRYRKVGGDIVFQGNKNEINSGIYESEDIMEKVVEFTVSKPAKAKQSMVTKKNGPDKRKKTIEHINVQSNKYGLEKEKVGNSASASVTKDDNDITSKKESVDIAEKMLESLTSKPTKAKQSEVEEKDSNKQKRRTGCGILLGLLKEKVSHSVADLERKDKKEITSPIHEPGDLEKMVESPISKRAKTKQSEVKEKDSSKQKKTTESVVIQPNPSDTEKEKVSHSLADLVANYENEINYQKHQSDDVMEKVLESPLSKTEKPKNHGDLDSEMEEELMDFRLEYGRELVSLRIMVWWPLDETYYIGTVESYNPMTRKHKIKYDDDDEEILDMSEETWELFKEIQSRQAHSSCEREVDPSPAKDTGETQKKTIERKAGSSKKDYSDPSSKRSKSEGHNIYKSELSALESPFVSDESDDEIFEENFSWKVKAMNRVGWKGPGTSRRKGKSNSGAPRDGAKTS